MQVVLLLEDAPLVAIDVEGTLSDAGFAVTTISSCADALEWLTVHRPDLVIVDIILRDSPCHAIVAKLKADNIPFLVHSGDLPILHADTPFAGGTWIGKPADAKHMVAAAQSILTV